MLNTSGPAVQQHQPAQGRDRRPEPRGLPARPRRQARRSGGHALHLPRGARLLSRPAARPDSGRTTSPTRPATWTVAAEVHEGRRLSERQVHGQRHRARSSEATPTRARRRCRSSRTGCSALGFKTTIKAVPQQTMYSKFCGYVKAQINVCPTAGWIEDFADPYAALFVPFSGKAIVPINNANWAVLNDPKVNYAIDSAAAISDQTRSASPRSRKRTSSSSTTRRRSRRSGPTTPWSRARRSTAFSTAGTTTGTCRSAPRVRIDTTDRLTRRGPRFGGAPRGNHHRQWAAT